MTNPEWTYNLLSISPEALVDFLKRSRLNIQTSLSSLSTIDSGDCNSEILSLYKSVSECCIVNFAEGCLIGGGLAAAVSILPSLVKGKFRRAAHSLFTLNNIRVSIFFGSLMAVHNTGFHIRTKLNRIISAKNLRSITQILAGLSVAILPHRVRKFLVYLLVIRALEVLLRRLRASRQCDPLITSHEAVGVTALSLAVITSTWFGWPQYVPKAYLHFLDNISDIEARQFRNVGNVLRMNNVNDHHELRYIVNMNKPCLSFHCESETCTRFCARVWILSLLKKTLPFYAKIYQIPILIQIIKNPKSVSKYYITKVLQRLVQSALFLSLLNGLVGAVCCSISNQTYIPHALMMPLAGAFSSLSLYVEQPARRIELALYMGGQALQMLVNAWTQNGLPSIKYLDVLVSAQSVAILAEAFHNQVDEPALVLRQTYFDLLGRILDSHDRRHSFSLKIF